MVKTLLISVILFFALPGVALSDPIQDGSFNTYEAGWFPNTIKGKLLNCQQTCQTNGAVPEYEASASVRTKRTQVCKVGTRRPNQRLITWSYGNQFDSTPVCYTTDISGRAAKSERFHCLCVKKSSGCQGPDLVVTVINRPTWDSTNHRSVITATIKNIGNMAAGASIARVIDPSTNQPTGAPYNAIANTPALAPGASFTVTFYLPYWVYNPDALLEVTADYKGMVTECNEKNNQKTFNELG